MIKTSDWIIDLGPEGGAGGVETVVAQHLATLQPASHTGSFADIVGACASPHRGRTDGANVSAWSWTIAASSLCHGGELCVVLTPSVCIDLA